MARCQLAALCLHKDAESAQAAILCHNVLATAHSCSPRDEEATLSEARLLLPQSHVFPWAGGQFIILPCKQYKI